MRWAGKAGGAVASTAKGFGPGAGGGYGAAAVFLVWMGALVASTVGGAAVGAVAGAVTAVPADTVRQAEAALTGALSSLNAHDELRARVLRLAQQGAMHDVVAITAGPSSPHDRLDYSWVGMEGVDSVLEITVLTVELAGEWDVDPPVTLTLAGATRLVRVRDGTEIDGAPVAHVAGTRHFTEWAADEARLFRDDLDRALDALAELIADRYFLPGLGYPLNIPEE